MRGFAKGTWNNVSEAFLTHGANAKTVGNPTDCDLNKLTDINQEWMPGQYKGAMVVIGHGKGFGQYRKVLDNTESSLILEKPWKVIPDKTSEYFVGELFTENVFYGNVNASPGRMVLWLDCLANTVELYREELGGGLDLVGQDRAYIDENGMLVDETKLYPSYYNLIYNSWFDGSQVKIATGIKSPSVYNSPALLGNMVIGNKVRYPYLNRNTFTAQDQSVFSAGISITPYVSGTNILPDGDRQMAFYTIISDNLITHSKVGVDITNNVNKTFVMNNKFDEVTTPLKDFGAKTVCINNKNISINQTGTDSLKIVDYKSEKEVPIRENRPFKVKKKESMEITVTKNVIARMITNFNHPNVTYQSAEESCFENLKRIYQLIVQFEKKEGSLPNVAFYPKAPFSDKNSLLVILGENAKPYLTCQSLSPEINNNTGLSYLWNSPINGKSLKELKSDKPKWLLMDVSAVNSVLITKGHAGHGGGVNVLFTDGTVRWLKPGDIKSLIN
jgi:prepilin-type processing-associated H-X9-DG protein